MKKIKYLLVSLLVISSCFIVNVTDSKATDSLFYTKESVEFDLSNPNKQSKTIIKDGKKVTFSISENLSVKPLSEEYMPWGDFTRRFECTDSVHTMSAIVKGYTNRYVIRIDKCYDGRYNSHTGTFIRERYDWGRENSDSSKGFAKYEVDHSLPHGGTYTNTLFMRFYAERVNGTRVVVTI